MKKFVFVYYGTVKHEEVTEEAMNAWKEWFGSIGEKMVDGGNPFDNEAAQSVTADEVKTIPADMWPAKGYSIVNAKDMDEAVEMAKGCPALKDDPDGGVRVYEALPM